MNEEPNNRPDMENQGIAATPPAAKPLSAAAKRALAEAEARRKAEKTESAAPEIGGRGGADPARFGDWEINGRAIDF